MRRALTSQSEAITALGGGGQAAPWAVNGATALSYALVSHNHMHYGRMTREVDQG